MTFAHMTAVADRIDRITSALGRAVAWLALLSFGEAWHHNHHAFPRSAAHGLRRWERWLDPSALVITMREKVGLARNVVRIAPERQDERERQAGPMRAGVGV